MRAEWTLPDKHMKKDNEKRPEQYDDIKIVSARTVEDILRAREELKAFGFDPELLDEMEPDVRAELLEDAGFDPWVYGY